MDNSSSDDDESESESPACRKKRDILDEANKSQDFCHRIHANAANADDIIEVILFIYVIYN